MRYFPLLLISLLLIACSKEQKGMGDTLKLAVFGQPDVELTEQQVRDTPYASMYARLNEGSRIFVVLGFKEPQLLKWVTHDAASFTTTYYGRLVATSGLTDNLQQVTNLEQDPLHNSKALTEGMSWKRTLFWTEEQKPHSVTLTSVFHLKDNQPLTRFGKTYYYRLAVEEVTAVESGIHYRNRFWINPITGSVDQSEQFIGPDFFPIEMTLLKSYSR